MALVRRCRWLPLFVYVHYSEFIERIKNAHMGRLLAQLEQTSMFGKRFYAIKFQSCGCSFYYNWPQDELTSVTASMITDLNQCHPSLTRPYCKCFLTSRVHLATREAFPEKFSTNRATLLGRGVERDIGSKAMTS